MGDEYQRIVKLSLSYLSNREMKTMVFEAANVVKEILKPFLLVQLTIGRVILKKKIKSTHSNSQNLRLLN